MIKLFLFSILFYPLLIFGQMSESLLNNIRQATDQYYLVQDTLPIVGSNTLPCLDVFINGKGPYQFLIDLGSNVMNFKQSVAEDADMEVIIDRERGDIVKADKLQIGNNVYLDVYGAAYKVLDVDGVIGFNLLSKGNFLMDYPNMKFAFITLPVSSFDSTYINYETIGRMPFLKSKIGNKSVFINFDTGASGWLYFPEHYKDSVDLKTSLIEGKKVWNNQTGTTSTYVGQICESVRFGNFIIQDPYVVFDPDIEDLFVGSSLLRDFILSFYPSREFVKMERPLGNKIINIPEDELK